MAKGEVQKVLRFMVEQRDKGTQYLWYGLIAKKLNMHHETARRVIEGYLGEAIEYVDVDPLIELGFRIKPFRVKDSVNVLGYMKYLKGMKKI